MSSSQPRTSLKLYNTKVLICVIYRPPNVKITWWDEFEMVIQEVKNSMPGHIVITGDFNCDPKPNNGYKLLEYQISIILTLK